MHPHIQVRYVYKYKGDTTTKRRSYMYNLQLRIECKSVHFLNTKAKKKKKAS